MQVYLNGEYVPADQARVSVWDGGFLFGDGVYTTLRVYAGRPVDLAAHWHRLRDHAHALQIPLDLSLQQLEAIVARLVQLNGLTRQDGRLRVTVTRGGSPAAPLPLADLHSTSPTILATLVPVSASLAAWQSAGIAAVVLGPTYARAHFPELKTLNGLTSVLALRQAARQDAREAILTTARGRILEGAVSNIFMVLKGHLCTPAAQGGFLPGLTRGRILDLATALGIPAEARVLTRRDLTCAREVFCASSVREILPVITIDHRPVGAGEPGPVTRALQDAYAEAMARA